MTIDERAENYGADLCEYCRECEGEKSCQHKIDAMHGYKDGFKEGLKQKVNITTISDCPIKDDWHDLRKDPNDLPLTEKEVMVFIEWKNTENETEYAYDLGTRHFNGDWCLDVFSSEDKDVKVIAWCDFRQFKE